MARLVILYGSKHESTLDIDVPKLVIGRGEDVGLQVKNQTVSRHHCVIEAEGTRHLLIDLDSTSGTFVNGTRLSRPVTLDHGDRIELGKHTLVYERASVETGSGQALDPDAATGPESGSGFWKEGLAESGFKQDSAGVQASASGSGGAPWEEQPKSASELVASDRQASAENYAGTMLASEGEMKRIRESLLLTQGPHLAVVVRGERKLVSMADDRIEVGFHEGADFRLNGSRFLGAKQFRVFPSGDAYMLKVLSMWAKVSLGGKRTRGVTLIKSGQVIEADGLKFKFSKGD